MKANDYTFEDRQRDLNQAWEIQKKEEEKEEFQQIDLFRFLVEEKREKKRGDYR